MEPKVICAYKNDECPSFCSHYNEHYPMTEQDGNGSFVTCVSPGFCFSMSKDVFCVEVEK